MAQLYDLQFNKDDVIIRNILIGVLATLNNKMYWYNKINKTVNGADTVEKRKITVPFYFSTTGDERFLMDVFMNDVAYEDPTLPSGKAETFYNKIPRGIMQLDGISIDAGSLTNKFVRAFYQRVQDDGTLTTFNSEVFMVPLKLPFTCSIYVDSNLDIFKAIQRVIEIFYKYSVFQIDVDGTRIPAVAGMPEEYNKERPIEYTFTDKKVWKVDFSIEVQTFMPIFKNSENGFVGAEDTEMKASNVIQSFQNQTNLSNADGAITGIDGNSSVDPFHSSDDGVSSGPLNLSNIKSPGKNVWPISPSGYSQKQHPTGGTHHKSS